MREFLFAAALPATLGLPLLWALLSLLWPRRAPFFLTACGALLQSAAAAALLWQVQQEGAWRHALGGWAAPLGIELRMDGPAVVFVLLTALVASLCLLHAHRYLGEERELRRFFWPLAWMLWAALDGLWLSSDLFNLYVNLELMSLSAIGLVAIAAKPDALSAALRYLLAALLGSLAWLLGVALIYGAHASLSLPLLAARAEPGATMAAALALMTLGLAFKSALFPLHGWLPPAHAGALTPVSALLSALVIKGSFYVLVRLWLSLGQSFDIAAAGNFLGLLGALAIFWGSWQALHQSRLKMLVAYSTVAQIGYFFLFFPLLAQESESARQMARDGVLLYLVSHALAKAGMFLAAGNLISSIGRDAMEGLRGISRYTPISLFSFALAGVTLMGLPPSGGFTAKWMLLQSALAAEYWHWMAVIVLGGLATACYVFRVFHISFREGPREDVFPHPSGWLEAAPMILALASVLLGPLAAGPLGILGLESTGGSGAP